MNAAQLSEKLKEIEQDISRNKTETASAHAAMVEASRQPGGECGPFS